ncbi:2175_t:CDS:2 [Funneliformis geosporum]|uniref:2175_t:CDS:1 n=1 Tax=Funneliformis geosporum TaxID=1117311 RepID=A0A9W4SNQ3_9GLOM|nr:2175_t:CDS:2 [Funneliformis geosporum]
MEGNFLSDLSCDLGRLLSSRDNYDVIIQAGEGQNMKEFYAHSLILGARSTYFKAALSKEWKEWTEKKNGIIIFKKPNVSPDTFEFFLEFVYTGIVKLDNYAVFYSSSAGPAFGSGCDLFIIDNYMYTHGHDTYPEANFILDNAKMKKTQEIVEYEVFQVLQK